MEIAERAPAFAGLYADDDMYVIKVTDGSRDSAEVARDAAAQILDHPELATAEIRAETADYSWRQLFTWYQALSDVLSVDGVVFTDINEAGNVIEVGVSNLDRYGPRVRSLGEAQNIPEDALRVIETEPITPIALEPALPSEPDSMGELHPVRGRPAGTTRHAHSAGASAGMSSGPSAGAAKNVATKTVTSSVGLNAVCTWP